MTTPVPERPAPPGFLRAKERALAAAIPLNAQLELTYACDCRCLFCYNSWRGPGEPPFEREDEFPVKLR